MLSFLLNMCYCFCKVCAIVSTKYMLSFLLNMCYCFIVFANPINCIQSIHAMACHGMVQPFHAKPMSPWRAPIVIWMLNLKKMLISSSKQCNKMILLAKQENVSNVIHSIHLRDILAYKTKSIFRTTISCFYGNHINSNSTIQFHWISTNSIVLLYDTQYLVVTCMKLSKTTTISCHQLLRCSFSSVYHLNTH